MADPAKIRHEQKLAGKALVRCAWVSEDPIYQAYHDTEWGVPERDDDRLFEKLLLDGAQAGLSWITILRKRDGYRAAFHGFDAERIARYTERDIERLMADPGIVRNRQKIQSAIGNAKAYCAMRDAGESFSGLIWSVTGGVTLQPQRTGPSDVPAVTPASTELSRLLRARGFSFVGPTIVYAFMQAVGVVNDHIRACHRFEACGGTR